MNKTVNKRPKVLENVGNNMQLNNTIFSHYETPMDFKRACEKEVGTSSSAQKYIQEGKEAWDNFVWDAKQEAIYKDVHKQVQGKLISRGFTTKMLYGTPEFTTENTGLLSKQRALLGRRDCYFKDSAVSEGNLFHDIFINLSYPWETNQNLINEKAMSMYALTKELSRFIKVRVFVVNWVYTDTPMCYSYPVKRYGEPINKKEFVFFTSMSKRTYGWSQNYTLFPHSSIGVGQPNNTVPLHQVNLDSIIDDIWDQTIQLRKRLS